MKIKIKQLSYITVEDVIIMDVVIMISDLNFVYLDFVVIKTLDNNILYYRIFKMKNKKLIAIDNVKIKFIVII